MAIQLVGIRSSASSAAGATSRTVPMPDGSDPGDFDGFESGDVAVLFAEVTSSTTASWSATGWDPPAAFDAGAAAQIAVSAKVLNSGDTSVTVSPGIASAQVNGLSAVVRVYRGVDPGEPLDVAAFADGSGTATASVAAASLTTATDGAVVVAAYGQTTPGGTSYTNWTAPAGMGNAGNVCSTVAAVNNAAIASFDMTKATAGATGTLTATSPQSRAWVYATLALKPAPPVTPPTFPNAPLATTVELQVAGAWTDITEYVYARDVVEIHRGQSDEASTADPSTLNLTLNNRDLRFSPRAALSPWYGKIGRNSPIRVSVDRPAAPATWLDYTGAPDGTGVKAYDVPGLDITGDIDVRVDVAPRSGVWQQRVGLISKYTTASDQRSWLLYLDVTGRLGFGWSVDGTSGTSHFITSTAAIDTTASRLAIRATLDVNNGASGCTVTFYTAPTIDGPWTQLGSAVVTAGTTSIYDSTAAITLARADGSGLREFNGAYYAVQVLNGIGGTAKADLDFRTVAEGATGTNASPLVDDAGLGWVIGAAAAVVAPAGLRFCGEVSEWPARADSTGIDVYTPVTASGLLRRAQQGSVPVQSTLTRILSRKATVRAYWPCEEGEDAERITSGIGGPPMVISRAQPGFAGYSGFHCTLPIPTLNDSMWLGAVPPYSDTGEIQVRFLMNVPSDTQTGDGQSIVAVSTGGSAALWHLSYRTAGAGSLRLEAFASGSSTPIYSSGDINFAVKGKDLRVSILLTQVGSNVQATIATYEIGAATGLFNTQTAAGTDIGRATSITVNNGGGIDDISIGQIEVDDRVVSIFDDLDQVKAYAGETAGRRFLRLAAENGLYARVYGDPDDTPAMGPQDPDTVINLLNQCVATDDGILFEPRDLVALAIRTRASMQNRAATVTLDYTTDLFGELEPVDDDRYTANDVTVARSGGSSTHVTDTTSALSTAAPPRGVGAYVTELELSLYRDLDTIGQASWHLHRGTVDEPRYPTLGVEMARDDIVADATVQAGLVAVDIGDRLTVANPPAWLPPGSIEQIVGGLTETLAGFTRTFQFALSPYSPLVVATYDSDRYDTAGSSLASAVTSSATSLSVATSAGPVWTTAAGDLPLDIVVGGERMTVTAISGASSPQTFTVTRSVAGVVKSHGAGEDVRLYQPAIRAL